MRILLDECVPKGLKRFFPPAHEVLTVAEVGWSGLTNGVLLGKASEQFEVFISVDASVRYQLRLDKYPLIFVLLEARSNDISSLEPLVPAVLQALMTAHAPQLIVIKE